jgi:AcrR family transcriptional regulator
MKSLSLRETIVEESMKLFSLKGYHSSSLQDILRASGSSKGGFYNHFKSKEDLFFHVLKRARSVWQEKNLANLAEIDDPLKKIELLLNNYKDRYLKNSPDFPGGCIFITLSVELNDRDPKMFSAINRGFTGVKNLLQQFLLEAKVQGSLSDKIDVGIVTEILFNGMLGAAICYGAGKSGEGLDTTIQALVNYLETLKKKRVA